MTGMKLLITGAFDWSDAEIGELEQMGHQVVFLQQEKESLPCEASDVEGVICNALFLYHPIGRFTQLRYIQLTSAGYDRVPMDYVKNHHIEIHNAKGVYSIPMAEFAVCGVLQIYKQSGFFRKNQEKHLWRKHHGLLELYGKYVLIIGCGSVGTECAKRFRAFGCRVSGVNRSVYESEDYDEIYPVSQLDSKLRESDIVIVSVPLTEDTVYLINRERLSHMKKGAVLVNIARGAVIESAALGQALQERLSGAVLDVFEQEPLEGDSSLWDRENVIITPHNSYAGEGNRKRLYETIMTNLRRREENEGK